MTAALTAGAAAFVAVALLGIKVHPQPRSRVTMPRPASGLTASSWRASVRLPRRQRAGHPGPDDVAEWCAALARALRSGHSLRAALAEVGPSSDALRPTTDAIRHRLDRGMTVTAAVQATAAHTPSADLAVATGVIAALARFGGASGEALDRAAAVLRWRALDAADRLVHSAQARLSTHVLTAVPLGFLGLLLATDPGVRSAVTAPVGAVAVAGGAALNATGWLWMRSIVTGQ